MRPVLVLVLFSCLLVHSECAKILGVFPAPGYSQFILGRSLMENLAKRGHEVTVISSHKPKTPIKNYETIHTKEIIDIIANTWGIELFALSAETTFTNIREVYTYADIVTKETLKHPKVQELIRSQTAKFDLVIVEQFFCESLMGFGPHFGAPIVLFSSIGASEWNSFAMGNPSLPSISPISFTDHSRHMRFFERLHNLIITIYENSYKHLVAYPRHAAYLKEYFPKPIDFHSLIYNASLMLLNSHVTTCEIVPLTQNMIEIGGFFIEQKPLRAEIQKFLDEAEDGVILFSLGTNLQVSEMSPEILNGILRVFGKLRQKVMWKTDVDIPNKPANVFTWRWLEQSDILAHPNLKLFITHGGLLSTTEAVHYGVPIIGIPIFGDQKMNMARAVQFGYAILIPPDQLNEESLSQAITNVLNNSSYHETARKLSNVMRDVVVRPIDLAMFSIESVLRQKGAHFQPAASNLYWFQLYSLDLLVFVLLFVGILIGILKYLLKLVLAQVKNETKKQKKQ